MRAQSLLFCGIPFVYCTRLALEKEGNSRDEGDDGDGEGGSASDIEEGEAVLNVLLSVVDGGSSGGTDRADLRGSLEGGVLLGGLSGLLLLLDGSSESTTRGEEVDVGVLVVDLLLKVSLVDGGGVGRNGRGRRSRGGRRGRGSRGGRGARRGGSRGAGRGGRRVVGRGGVGGWGVGGVLGGSEGHSEQNDDEDGLHLSRIKHTHTRETQTHDTRERATERKMAGVVLFLCFPRSFLLLLLKRGPDKMTSNHLWAFFWRFFFFWRQR